MSNRPSADGGKAIVTAPTLKEAYKLVHKRFGRNAVILGSRNIVKREALGLGREKLVEVTVQVPDGHPAAGAAAAVKGLGATGRPIARDEASEELAVEIEREVQRIEDMVNAIVARQDDDDGTRGLLRDNALGRTLVAGGASRETVAALLTRFVSETGSAVTDRAAALAWLVDSVKASNCDWDSFFGCHAFLGRAGSGRTSLVLESAARLQAQGRRTLVLSVLPAHKGEVRRLQVAAAAHGFDAAIIQRPSQLTRSDEQLAAYDAVLVDLPGLQDEALEAGSELQTWLANNAAFHRHLIVSLDLDPREFAELQQTARRWNCDWIAVSGLDRTRFSAKLLDLMETIPLPVSLTSAGGTSTYRVDIASSGGLLDLVLEANGKTTDERLRASAED